MTPADTAPGEGRSLRRLAVPVATAARTLTALALSHCEAH